MGRAAIRVRSLEVRWGVAGVARDLASGQDVTAGSWQQLAHEQPRRGKGCVGAGESGNLTSSQHA